MGRALDCHGTTYVGRVDDDLGEIAYVFCNACRSIVVEATDGNRKSLKITYLDPKPA